MTNSSTTIARRWLDAARLAALLVAALNVSCSSSHDDGGSSGSHWLTCDVDDDCAVAESASSCDADGYCVDAMGARIRVTVAGTSGEGGAGGAGGRGGAGGAGASGAGAG